MPIKASAAATRSQDIGRIETGLADLQRLTASVRIHDRWMRQAGLRLSRTQSSFLAWLDSDAQSVSELAIRAGISQPAATRAVDHLVQEGYATRRPDEADARLKWVSITPDGSQARQRVLQVMRHQLGASLDRLSAIERRQLAELLAKFVIALKATRPDWEPE
jgi:DNA-binding MarR family transcriptional regulator